MKGPIIFRGRRIRGAACEEKDSERKRDTERSTGHWNPLEAKDKALVTVAPASALVPQGGKTPLLAKSGRIPR